MRKTRSALDSERYSVVKDRRSPPRGLPAGPLEAGPPTRGGANRNRRRPGGADRDRTDDLRLAKPALSQLSYSPILRSRLEPARSPHVREGMVGLGRFELPTSRLSGGRSNRLSYRPSSGPPSFRSPKTE